jgi:hypothetical protein
VNAGGTIPWALVDKQAAGKPGAEAAVCDRGQWRLVEGGAVAWPRVASAVARQRRTFNRWVRLTGGPSPISDLIRFSKAPDSKFTNMIFWMSKNGETF